MGTKVFSTLLAILILAGGVAHGAPAADVASVAASTRTFSAKLYKALAQEAGSFFFSPASIVVALGMTYAGAKGETAAAMADTLAFELEGAPLHEALAGLLDEVLPDGDGATMAMANRLWGQEGVTFEASFLDLLGDAYGAPLAQVDFVTKAEEVRLAINGWVGSKTKGLIEDLLPKGLLDASTRLVLVNAIYFKGSWKTKFDEKETKPEPFAAAEGPVEVDMMHAYGAFPSFRMGTVKGLSLPYEGDDLSMVVLLPDEGTLDDLEESLDGELLTTYLSVLQLQNVDVKLPKMEATKGFRLGTVLKKLGMGVAFSSDADFSGMTKEVPLEISAVVHKAFVKVDEEGTEAAAATAVVMRECDSAPSEAPLVFHADRPFIYLIRHDATGAILFMGRMAGPTAEK